MPQRGGALVLRGEPGIGKSALLAEAVAAAAGRDMLVLGASGTQSEANLAFAGLHQLLRPLLGHVGDLPPRQRGALAAAFGVTDGPAPEPFLIAMAALQLLSDAAQNPAVLVAEDTQWLDRPTADVLAFIARRVESDSVLMLAAIRDGYPGPLLEAGLPELRVEGLASQRRSCSTPAFPASRRTSAGGSWRRRSSAIRTAGPGSAPRRTGRH